MRTDLPDSLLDEFGEFVARHLGLHFPAARRSDLARGAQSAAAEFGFDTAGACVRWLLSTPVTKPQIETLAGHLTIGETYFFRDKRAFELIEQRVLPELIRARQEGERRLRCWSAACCTGEEPYSLAIALRRALPGLAEWQVTVLGTDVNRHFLQKAARGVYGDWSFRETPPGFRASYFAREEHGWRIHRDIRERVAFSHLNLAEDSYPSLLNNTNALDLILCRNVLMYFTPEHAAEVARKLSRCLADGGWLVLGPNDHPSQRPPGLEAVRFGGTVFYRKGHGRSLPAESPRTEPYRAATPRIETPWTAGEMQPDKPTAHEIVSPRRAPELEAGDAALEKAREHFDEGRYADVAATLAPWVDHPKAEPRMLILLVRALANQGRLTAALAACDRLLTSDKLNPVGHYLRAGVLQEMGENDEAATALRRTLYLEPDFVLAHFALGNLARSQHRDGEAERHFDNALALVRRREPTELLPESDGLTAARMAEIIATLRPTASAA